MRRRRNPRAEREARRLAGAGQRPRFALATCGSGGRKRRDPRAEAAAVRVGQRPRMRLDRRGVEAVPPAAMVAAEPAPRRRVVAEPAYLIFAVAEAEGGRLSRHERQVLGAARRLADPGGGAVVLVAPSLAEDAGAAGADRLLSLAAAERYDPEAATALLAAAAVRYSPRHVLFAENEGGGDLARRLAARLGAPFAAGVEALSAREAVCPCRARRAELRLAPPFLLSLAPDRAAPHVGPAHEASPLDPPAAGAVRRGILKAAPLPVTAAEVPLAEAGLVVAAGNGVKDFAGFLRLCSALGATPGASRVVCDAGAMPRAAQVGASGTVLDALAYVAFGIAGAPQHLQGLGRVEHVAAVNTDIHAAMIARAELAIVQDAQRVMPALLALLEAGG